MWKYKIKTVYYTHKELIKKDILSLYALFLIDSLKYV